MLGCFEGRLSAKVHAATNALADPAQFILTGGVRNDVTLIEGFLDGLKAGHVLADVRYDGQRRNTCRPTQDHQHQWPSFDATSYQDRNLIDRRV